MASCNDIVSDSKVARLMSVRESVADPAIGFQGFQKNYSNTTVGLQ